MRIPFLASLVLVSSLASSAFAQGRRESPWYITFNGGAASVADVDDNPTGTVSYDLGISTAVAIGKRLSEKKLGLAAELEALYTFARLDDGDLVKLGGNVPRNDANLAFFLNGLLEWNVGRQFAWYGGAGIGYATGIKLESFDFGDLRQVDKDALAFQFKLGGLYRLGGNLDFLFGYRYYQTEDVEIDNVVSQTSFDISNQQNIFEVGLRWGL